MLKPIARILSYGSEIADDPAVETSLIDALEQLDRTATLVANNNREFLPLTPRVMSTSPDPTTRTEGGSEESEDEQLLFTGGDYYSRLQ